MSATLRRRHSGGGAPSSVVSWITSGHQAPCVEEGGLQHRGRRRGAWKLPTAPPAPSVATPAKSSAAAPGSTSKFWAWGMGPNDNSGGSGMLRQGAFAQNAQAEAEDADSTSGSVSGSGSEADSDSDDDNSSSASEQSQPAPSTELGAFSLLFVNATVERRHRVEQMQEVFTSTMVLGGLFGLFNLVTLAPSLASEKDWLVFVLKIARFVGPCLVSCLLYFGVLRREGGSHAPRAVPIFEVAVTLQIVSDCWTHCIYAGRQGQDLPPSALFVAAATVLTGFPWLYHAAMGTVPIVMFALMRFFACTRDTMQLSPPLSPFFPLSSSSSTNDFAIVNLLNNLLILPGFLLIAYACDANTRRDFQTRARLKEFELMLDESERMLQRSGSSNIKPASTGEHLLADLESPKADAESEPTKHEQEGAHSASGEDQDEPEQQPRLRNGVLQPEGGSNLEGDTLAASSPRSSTATSPRTGRGASVAESAETGEQNTATASPKAVSTTSSPVLNPLHAVARKTFRADMPPPTIGKRERCHSGDSLASTGSTASTSSTSERSQPRSKGGNARSRRSHSRGQRARSGSGTRPAKSARGSTGSGGHTAVNHALDRAGMVTRMFTASAARKSFFLATMSHELRSPLTAILGSTEVLSRTLTLNEESASLFDLIRSSGAHLLSLVNDIMDFSKLSTNKEIRLKERPFDPVDLARDAASIFAPQAAVAGVGLRFDVKGLPSGTHLVGDKDRVEQIIVNLLSNAIKFTKNKNAPVRKIALRLAIEGDKPVGHGSSGKSDSGSGLWSRSHAPSGSSSAGAGMSTSGDEHSSASQHSRRGRRRRRMHRGSRSGVGSSSRRSAPSSPESRKVVLVLSVEDTGIGMPEAVQQSLFQPFQQGDESSTRQHGGTGLGLYISSQLVKLMGGNPIQVKSTVGVGSLFRARLELRAIAAPPSLAEALCLVDGPARSTVNFVQQPAQLLASSGEDTADDHRSTFDKNMNAPSSRPTFETAVAQGVRYAAASAKVAVAARRGVEMQAARRHGVLAELQQRLEKKEVTLPNETERKVREKPTQTKKRPVPGLARGAGNPSLEGKHILLVDDVKSIRMVGTRMLQRLGATVQTASNGVEAVEVVDASLLGNCKSQRFDCVLMDFHMPFMDGIEATRLINEKHGPNAPTVIGLTADTMEEAGDEFTKAGVAAIVTKPYNLVQLSATISHWCKP
eukprot:INCI5245.1.p1 GENE.INCI5245.1~~INCI5245.1.p1  ORF type:complete len:1203 (-),score=179.69 INCI5245.1:1960-5568(-)